MIIIIIIYDDNKIVIIFKIYEKLHFKTYLHFQKYFKIRVSPREFNKSLI